MMRLDKFLCHTGAGTRSEVKIFIRKGQVQVNGITEKDPGRKVAEDMDRIFCSGKEFVYVRFGYFMLNKPVGVVSATRDKKADTVLSLLKEPGFSDLFPVGRLDKDTEGLLLLTNDGILAHNLLSPKKHVDKTYLVETERPVFPEDILHLIAGVDIGDEKPTLPCRIKQLAPNILHLTVQEGRYHQVKRMLQAVNNQVIYLKRLTMGTLTLDDQLKPGQYRTLTQQEVALLKGDSYVDNQGNDFSV